VSIASRASFSSQAKPSQAKPSQVKSHLEQLREHRQPRVVLTRRHRARTAAAATTCTCASEWPTCASEWPTCVSEWPTCVSEWPTCVSEWPTCVSERSPLPQIALYSPLLSGVAVEARVPLEARTDQPQWGDLRA
jgi:hypothetical protein